jgi:hypothetical protein
MDNALDWLEPWYPVEGADICAAVERQLRVEVSRAHILHGESVRLIARRVDTDDALFALADGRVAEVHLTWKHGTEQDPRWPATAIFPSLETWADESMRPLHAELSRLR